MPLELEHAIGFSGTTDNGLHIHPSGEALIYAQGGCVLISSLSDAHEQQFLRGRRGGDVPGRVGERGA